MEKENVIIVQDVKKSFKVYLDRSKTLKDSIVTRKREKYIKREVLKGISFVVKKGEAVGLIGKNGCGKSTTLKLLTKIIYPNSGKIEVKGRISSLLELGAGFHPDMSGRENIYLNASIFGLTKKEIEEKIDGIIEFSELEDFIENPVRTYSSGMYMRLAFSVAINVDADVLLIDEILGVGDVSFQKKCFEKLKEIKMSGTTIVIVSHSLEQIEQICDRCIWVSEGRIKEEGKPRIVNAHYYKEMEDRRLSKKEDEILNAVNENEQESENQKIKEAEKTDQENIKNAEEVESPKTILQTKTVDKKEKLPYFCDKMAVRTGNQKVEITNIELLDRNERKKIVFEMGEAIKIACHVKSKIGNEKVSVSLSIWRDDGILCYGVNTYFEKEQLLNVGKNGNIAELMFPDVKLLGGKYWINVGLYSKEIEEYDSIKYAKQFYIKSGLEEKEYGIYQMEHLWRLSE